MKIQLTDKDKVFLTDLKKVLDKYNASIEVYSDENMEGAYLNINYSDGAMDKIPDTIDSQYIKEMFDKGYYIDYFINY